MEGKAQPKQIPDQAGRRDGKSKNLKGGSGCMKWVRRFLVGTARVKYHTKKEVQNPKPQTLTETSKEVKNK